MKLLLATLCAAVILHPPQAVLAQAQESPARPAQHRYVIADFKTEAGVVLPQAVVVYGTYGKLNPAKDNVVLLPSHYMATNGGYDWLIGKGKALDPDKLFLVMTEMFGNGRSSSPSNTPEPFHGPRFPAIGIRDDVEAARQVLEDDLGVHHLRAIVGFSMGAQQAFQWAVSHPAFADRIVATSGTAKTWPHGYVRLEGQIRAITADAAFKNGDYTEEPTAGIEATGAVWLGWLYSQEWWHQGLWQSVAAAHEPPLNFRQYVDDQIKGFFAGLDANDLILQMRTWQSHDVGGTPGFDGSTEKALRSITAPILYMPSATDLYFPVTDARTEAQFLRHVTLRPIPSLWGHPAGAGAGPGDLAFLNAQIHAFVR
jgi:homoserine O-acetyltransferase